MTNVAPGGTGGGSSAPWWVFALAYPSQPSTSVPDYVQAPTKAAAEQQTGGTTPPLAGPFATKTDAENWVSGAGAQYFGPGKTNIAPPVDTPVTQGIPGPASFSPLTGLAAIGDFFQRLSQASTWVRVGEVVLGLILLSVGVARVTNAVPVATKVARTAGAVALV